MMKSPPPPLSEQLQQETRKLSEDHPQPRSAGSAPSDPNKEEVRQPARVTPKLAAPITGSKRSEADSTATSNTSVASSSSFLTPPVHGKLRALTKLYGRDSEVSKIHEVYHRVVGQQASNTNVVILSASPGVGKTAVARNLRDSVQDDDGLFLSWQFDHLCEWEAGSSFTDAFSDLCHQIMRKDDHVQRAICDSIRAAGPVDNAILLDMFPWLEPIIGEKQVDVKANGIEASSRHVEIFKHFLKSVSSKENPLVVLFEDVQFGDICSRSMLRHIILDPGFSNVLFILSVRPNEICEDTRKLLKEVDEANVEVTNIELNEIDEQTVNQIVADTLRVDVEVSLPMSKFVYHHSKGNVRFVLELLRVMREAEILTFDEENRTWHCEEEKIALFKEHEDLPGLMEWKLRTLSPDLKEVLTLSAYIGATIDMNLVGLLIDDPERCISDAIELGLIEPYDECHRIYRFTHRAVRRAAYGLIPEEEQAAFHLAIGRKLWKKIPTEELFDRNTVVLNQLKRGAAAITDQQERHTVVSLCLVGADKVVEWGNFASAKDILDLGISLLDDRSWRDEYELTLTLHNTIAEILYTLGAFDRSLVIVDAILANGRHLEHKVQAYGTKLNVLGVTAKLDGSIAIALDVLEQLGEGLPSHPTHKRTMKEFVKMGFFMKRKTQDMLLRLPPMTDTRKIAALQIMNLVAAPALMGRPTLAALLTIKMMRITVKHGLSAISAFVFGLYGSMLANFVKDIQGGTRFAHMALKLLERYDCKQWMPRVYMAVFGATLTYTMPLRASFEYLEKGYQIGKMSGDVEFAMLNANMQTMYKFISGEPLPSIIKDMRNIEEEMAALNQESNLRILKPTLYMCIAFTKDGLSTFEELLSKDGSFTVPTFGSQDAFIECMKKVKGAIKRLVLSNHFGDYRSATKSVDILKTMKKIVAMKAADATVILLFTGVTLMANAKQTGKGRRAAIRLTRANISKLECMAKFNTQLYLPKSFLLKAELAAFTGKHEIAANHYYTAIALFAHDKDLPFEALALEHAGRFMLERGKKDLARDQLQKSIARYSEWGATGKVVRLEKQVSALLDN